MQNKLNTNIERIIAKIDNDFNPDNSDWIPRVGAWAIDAMNMLKILRTEKKRTKLLVQDRIAMSNCPLDDINIKVYDAKGCLIELADNANDCSGCSSTGEESQGAERSVADVTNTMSIVYNGQAIGKGVSAHAQSINTQDGASRYNVVNTTPYAQDNRHRNYVIVDCNKIELNFDTPAIYIEQEVVKTHKSPYFNCELPVIPNNGLVIEAIAYYCIYKMLCRGYKHPVFNLSASQYGTNPYYIWMKLKDEAERSVILDAQGDVIDDGGLWRSAFLIDTFNPRQ